MLLNVPIISPEVLLTHTRELGALLHAVHSASTKIGGAVDFTTAINVAQLALKHRQNKNLRQRIIVFLGSPLQGNGTDEKSMTKLAKKLKKNNIAIDVVCFGDGIEEVQSQGEGSTEGAASTSILKTFVENACSADNS
jgi:26S proteasome regulatory subunit N10